MKRLIFIVLCVALSASSAMAGHQYSSPALDNLAPGSVPKNDASLMYGYDGVSKYYIPHVASDGSVLVTANTDTGRTEVRYYAVAAAAGATTVETAITLTKSSMVSATTTSTGFVIPAGKKFRITHLSVATRGHATATIQTTTFNLRVSAVGALTTSSTPVVFSARSATPATASDWDRYVLPIPEGFEITGDGTLSFGITAAATYTTNAPTWDVNIIGYEY